MNVIPIAYPVAYLEDNNKEEKPEEWMLVEGKDFDDLYNGRIVGGTKYGVVISKDKIYYRNLNLSLVIDKADLYYDNLGYLSYDMGDKTRHFIFGGGYEADDILLTKLAQEYKVFAEYVRSFEIENKSFRYDFFSADVNALHLGLIDGSNTIPTKIENISLNVPYLTENYKGKEYIYDNDIFRYRFFIYDTYKHVSSYFVMDKTPMVEGAPGNGTGMEITVDFYMPSDNLVVLNGFVDFERPHLYKNNARIKKVLVEGDGFSFEHSFDDNVHFEQIDFPNEVDKVKVTVLEVYDGLKYNDLCISGIFTNPDWYGFNKSFFRDVIIELTEKDTRYFEIAKENLNKIKDPDFKGLVN